MDGWMDKNGRMRVFLFTCCLTNVDRSPRIGPNPVNSVSLRMTHSMSSRSDNSNAFQCSVLFSRRFLEVNVNKFIVSAYILPFKGLFAHPYFFLFFGFNVIYLMATVLALSPCHLRFMSSNRWRSMRASS